MEEDEAEDSWALVEERGDDSEKTDRSRSSIQPGSSRKFFTGRKWERDLANRQASMTGNYSLAV